MFSISTMKRKHGQFLVTTKVCVVGGLVGEDPWASAMTPGTWWEKLSYDVSKYLYNLFNFNMHTIYRFSCYLITVVNMDVEYSRNKEICFSVCNPTFLSLVIIFCVFGSVSIWCGTLRFTTSLTRVFPKVRCNLLSTLF